MLIYVYKNLRYPTDARKNGIEGLAVVQFVVGKDGFLSEIEVLRDPGSGLGEAAKEVIESMNELKVPWIPGKGIEGQAVEVKYTLPIKFKI